MTPTNEPENQYPHVERRVNYPCGDHEKRLTLTERSVTSVEKTMDGVSTKLDLILAQVTKIALLELSHQNAKEDITRAHDRVGKMEESLNTLALESRAFMNTTKGMMKIVWGIGGAVGLLLVKVLFFAANNGMTP